MREEKEVYHVVTLSLFNPSNASVLFHPFSLTLSQSPCLCSRSTRRERDERRERRGHERKRRRDKSRWDEIIIYID